MPVCLFHVAHCFFFLRSRGFILEGFPRNEDETRLISTTGFFADAAILLAVEDTEIVKRLLPAKMSKWRIKRDIRLVEKGKQKEIALKAKVCVSSSLSYVFTSVCLSVCLQDISKRIGPICM